MGLERCGMEWETSYIDNDSRELLSIFELLCILNEDIAREDIYGSVR